MGLGGNHLQTTLKKLVLEIEVWNYRNQCAADLCHFKASNVSSVYASQVFYSMYCGTQQARMTPTRLLDWKGFFDLEQMASFSHDLPKSTLSKKPQSLERVITWLESNHKVRFTMDLHNLVKTTEQVDCFADEGGCVQDVGSGRCTQGETKRTECGFFAEGSLSITALGGPILLAPDIPPLPPPHTHLPHSPLIVSPFSR